MKAILHWLKMLFHIHEWEIVEVNTARRFENDYAKRAVEARKIFVQQCKMCGKLRKVTIEI